MGASPNPTDTRCLLVVDCDLLMWTLHQGLVLWQVWIVVPCITAGQRSMAAQGPSWELKNHGRGHGSVLKSGRLVDVDQGISGGDHG